MKGRGNVVSVRSPTLVCDGGGVVRGEGGGGGVSGTIVRVSCCDHVGVGRIVLSVEGVAGRSVRDTRTVIW